MSAMNYKIDEKSLSFLKEATEAIGPSGFEEEVLTIFKKHYSVFADDVRRDNLGSLVLVKKGTSERPRVLVAGHVDEVGFLVTSITNEGFVTFTTLGGWFEQVLLAQRVVIKTRKGEVVGVITSKPPHLLTPEERQKVIQFSQMYIDVGATSKEEAESLGIRVGDPVVPWSPFMKTSLP
ncbi:MAG: M42 family metallopeptidase, partial [Infirmifilum sp.]